jgi:hypothetical protein
MVSEYCGFNDSLPRKGTETSTLLGLAIVRVVSMTLFPARGLKPLPWPAPCRSPKVSMTLFPARGLKRSEH